MLTFNDTSLIGNYVKQLLHTFNLPVAKVMNSEYESNKNLDGFLFIDKNRYYRKGQHSYPYKFGMKLDNITKNCKVDNLIYDSYTHNYLGEYLRFIRDYKKLNLMSMYNCFTNEIVNNLELEIKLTSTTQEPRVIQFNSDDSAYKIYAVPVKFSEVYTIAIDSDTPIYMCSGFYKERFIPISVPNIPQETIMVTTSTQFSEPFVYDKLNKYKKSTISKELLDKESCLKLFIKVPVTSNSSIVILEGDYRSNNDKQIVEDPIKHTANNYSVVNKNLKNDNETLTYSDDINYISSCQLLEMNTGTHYMVADRLIEYLIGNTIDKMTKIQQDIKALQLLLNNKYNYTIQTVGNWDNTMRDLLYRVALHNDLVNTENDILGYFDKDVEHELPDIDAYKDDNKNLEEYK